MAESLLHMKFVERMVEYAKTIPNNYSSSMMCVDLPTSVQQTPKVINGYIPDLYYYDMECAIIGEAKTTDDIDNEHTDSQINSYIDEVRTHSCHRHIILCTSMLGYAQLCNMIIFKKKEKNISDITFHVLDNHLRSKLI